jgi:hypothetical protein
MITRPFHRIGNLLVVVLAATVAGTLGCGKDEQAEQARTDHAHHEQQDSGNGTTDAHGGHDGGRTNSTLMVSTDPAKVNPGELVTLHLMIHDATGAMIKEFETLHEKPLHLMIVRDGLDRFAHIHPAVDPTGNITATFAFPTAGEYRLYADYKPKGMGQATAISEVHVAGIAPARPELVANTPGQVVADGLVASIDFENATAGRAVRIAFTLSDEAGEPIVNLQQYLGARGHLVILSADGMQYVHAHPLEKKSSDGAVEFEAHFPQPGIYKAWGQFQFSERVHDVPFVVEVK